MDVHSLSHWPRKCPGLSLPFSGVSAVGATAGLWAGSIMFPVNILHEAIQPNSVLAVTADTGTRVSAAFSSILKLFVFLDSYHTYPGYTVFCLY